MTAIQRWLFGFVVGTAITSIPFLAGMLNSDALWLVNMVMLPGGLVALLLSAGNVHTKI
jgi:hypothetical protein